MAWQVLLASCQEGSERERDGHPTGPFEGTCLVAKETSHEAPTLRVSITSTSTKLGTKPVTNGPLGDIQIQIRKLV